MNETTTTWHHLPELPDTDREVLVAYKWNKVPVQAYCKNGHWWGSVEVRDNENSALDTEYLVAWCELPEVPKEISGL